MRTLVAVLVFGFLSCTPPRATTPTPTPVDDGHEVKMNPIPLDLDPDADQGIVLDVHAEADSSDPAAIVKYVPPSTTPLSAKDSQRLFGRLPKLEHDATFQTTFAMREKTLPPPKAGVTEQLPFPPPEAPANGPPKVEVTPLTVLRYSPMADTDLAPELSVTFSQPMVAVGTVDQVATVLPVKLKPDAPGKWQWKGAQTLVFASAERMPMATHFEAEIPAGVKSVNGGVLAKTVKWGFSTPAPKIVAQFPQGVIETQTPVIFLGFDQRVNADAIIAALTLKVNNKKVGFRKATDAEIAADPVVKQYVQPASADRSVAIVAKDPLPLASTMLLTLAKGAPSAEGPLTTPAEQQLTFQTYGPFVFVEGVCSEKPCRPTSYVYLTFSNSIDPASFEGRVHITPETPGLAPVISGYHIQLDGRKKANTRYSIQVDAGLKDIHGQALAKAVSYSFETGSADPQFALSKDFFQTQSPAVPSVDVWAVGQPSVKVDVYKVTPKDWVAYRTFAQSIQYYSEDESKPIPGKKLRSTKLDLGSPDEMTPTSIDLKDTLDHGSGNAVVVVTGRVRYRDKPVRRAVWVQMTNLALDAFDDNADLTAWVTDLTSGAPVKGATVEIYPSTSKADSDANGIAHIAFDNRDTDERILIARKGDDLTFLPGTFTMYGGGRWIRYGTSAPSTLAYVTDDRGMYKPGETVHIKGWFRDLDNDKASVLHASQGKSIRWVLRDPQYVEVAKGIGEISKLGGFDFTIDLPKTMSLGQAYLQIGFRDPSGKDDKLKADEWSATTSHNFQVQEFRRPEFEVNASVSDGVHIVGEQASATVKAAYYAGGALQAAPVTWSVTARKASFTPPGRDSYIFGSWEPWWHVYGWGQRYDTSARSYQVNGATDARGTHRIAIAAKSVKPERATSVEATATVADVNRQRWTSRATMLVHAASTYAGVKPERMFVDPGKAAKFDLIAADLDGKLVSGADLHIVVTRYGHKVVNGQYRDDTTVATDVTVQSADKPVTWTFTPKEGGRFSVAVSVKDDKGRLNATDLSLWVSGEKLPESDALTKQELTLIPSKKLYAAGDTAEVLVQSPFTPAEGIFVVERNGILSSERFKIVDGSATIKVPVTKELAPNVRVAVEVVGSQGDGKKKRPAHAGGALDLAISTDAMKLAIDVVPQSWALSPGQSTTVDVTVKDMHGKAVSGAEVAVIVVDEAVLALSGFQLKDPLAVMTPQRGAGTNASGIRDTVVIARGPSADGDDAMASEAEMDKASLGEAAAPASLAAPAPMRSMARMKGDMKKESGPGGGGGDPPIEVRTDFSAIAAFIPKLMTDGSGRVSTVVKLPDNLTRYRVMAIAAGEIQFGKGESSLTARLPLMVRPSAPRFLNFGDTFELPAVVQNQTDETLEVDVVVRALNAEVPKTGLRVRVAGGQRVEVRFPASTIAPGTARFQIGAASGSFADAADIKLPVWTPATSEAFATYGVLDGDAAIKQPVSAPADVYTETGGLTVSTSSTVLQSLTDAMLYLSDYPYGCTEQVSSRLLAVVSMKDVLEAFKSAELPDPKKLLASVDADIAILARRQTGNGGIGFWSAGKVNPYASIHASHALLRAKAAGYKVPEQVLAQSLVYAKNVEKELSEYYPESRRYVVAYALAVRARGGDVDIARVKKLIAEAGLAKTSVETLGHLLGAAQAGKEKKLVEDLVGELNRRVTETASAAHFVTHYADGAHLIMGSDKRGDAIVLASLIGAKPQSDLIPKVMRGLLDGRRHGRWYTTQENVFVMLAVGDYFQTFEKQTPEFVARMWLGNDYAGEAAFHGRESTTREVQVPMKQLVAAAHDLVIQKKGTGRMYYRIGLDYTPKSLALAARDQGFEVSRTYEPIDGPSTVTRDADGTWRVQAGARVRVRLKMVAPSVRYFVALVDPMPAGFEAVNAALAVSEDVPDDNGLDQDDIVPSGRRASRKYVPWWMRNWFDHENLRDERVEAFSDELYAGVHEYTYVARATTPGTFIVPPTKAEEMYAPETFGRAASEKVIVE